jgi:hypothetical protein
MSVPNSYRYEIPLTLLGMCRDALQRILDAQLLSTSHLAR